MGLYSGSCGAIRALHRFLRDLRLSSGIGIRILGFHDS